MSNPGIVDVDLPKNVFLFDVVIDLGTEVNFGDCGRGDRRLFPATGGRFSGPDLSGKVLSGGGDWASFDRHGSMHLDVRLTLQTDDDQNIHMSYQGRFSYPEKFAKVITTEHLRHTVDHSEYYFRTTPLFQTGSAKYKWLNSVVAVGVGYFVEGGIAYRVAKVV